MSATHEDIRFKVLRRLRECLLTAIDRIVAKRLLGPMLDAQLKEYKGLIERGEDIPLIIKNEKILEGIGRPDIEVFGGKLIIEIKVKLNEFQSGVDRLKDYVKVYPYAKYAIITNWENWEFYQIQPEFNLVQETTFDAILEEILSEGVTIPLSTENVRNMFNPIVLLEQELHQIFVSSATKNTALFESYRNIIKRLYEKALDEETEKLFIKHTLIQIIVSSCLTSSIKKNSTPLRAGSGADIEIEIVLPYLNWWAHLVEEERLEPLEEKFMSSLLESVYSRALLFDWDPQRREDVFRELYEILIDAETRRKIGEYYTPLWVAEYMVEKAALDFNGLSHKTVLDPFCGSGTFLVMAFYRKVSEGENPDSAIREVIGFDINPLAVSIARAELMIAFQTKSKAVATPLVFNTDSASLLLKGSEKWAPTSFLQELRDLEEKIGYVHSPIFASTSIDFSEILRIEMILRERFKEAAESSNAKQVLEEKLPELAKEEWKGALTGLITETLASKDGVKAISNLIEKFGNGVWAVSVTSLFAPQIIQKAKVKVVLTNPPWAQLTEQKGVYGELMRNRSKELLKLQSKSAQIMSGSDISTVMLFGSIKIAETGVSFLMPKEVVYTSGSFYGLGKILTYNVIKRYEGEVIEINCDAFLHGRLPSIVALKKEQGAIKCLSMDVRWNGKYSKALHLFDVNLSLEEDCKYSEYMKKVILYTKTTLDSIRGGLGVEQVVPMGDYIRGLLGGMKKKGAKKYAGLAFQVISQDTTARQYSIRLAGTQTPIRMPEFFLQPYWKKLVYMGEIFPFYANSFLDVLLSSRGEEDLKKFLESHILESASAEDKVKVKTLIEEVKQPKKLKPLQPDKYYVVYRRSRAFASFVLTPEKIQAISENGARNIILYDDCSYVICENEPISYYYSALLNFLVWTVIEEKGVFVRHQYLRPLMAIQRSNLEWANENWQLRIAEVSQELHREAPSCYTGFIRRGIRVEALLKRLADAPNTRDLFNQIAEIVGKNSEKENINLALELVCKR